MSLLANCDTLDYWTPIYGTIELDPTDKIEGLASIKLTGDGTNDWVFARYNPSGTWDLSGKTWLKIGLNPEFRYETRIHLIDINGVTARWFLGPLPSGWSEYQINLDAPSDVVGVFDKTQVEYITILHGVVKNPSYIKIDAITVGPVTPEILSISVAPTSTTIQVGQQQNFIATVSGGTSPYTVNWIDATSGSVLDIGFEYVFDALETGSFAIYAEATDSVGDTVRSADVPITVTEAPTPPPPPEDYIVAASGRAFDIRTAITEAIASGVKNVLIPEGTFNFYEVGEVWAEVAYPAGINLFGTPTERDANNQVIGWKTILVMPFEAPNLSAWFRINGTGNPAENPRFSDIKLVGYRYFDNASVTTYYGLFLHDVLDFRVDHCNFQDMAQSAIWAGSPMKSYNHGVISGVIDHCRLVNSYGDPGWPDYATRTLGYGIGLRRWACDLWEPDVSKVVGKYNNYTVFIEDCYFSKWRHCVASNDGIHYVFRRNVVEGDYAIGSVDAHGSFADASQPYAVGTRAIEVYDNVFKNPDTTWNSKPWAINLRGGAGIIFNNKLEGYYALMHLNNDWGNYDPYCPQCLINDTYIWNNNLGGGLLIDYIADSVENVNFFLRPPSLAQDGWEYTSYPYPHPLVTEAPPKPPIKDNLPLLIVGGLALYSLLRRSRRG